MNEKDKFSQPEGFSAWKFNERIIIHEQSASHRECILKARTMCTENARIDCGLEQQIQDRKQYWIDVLRRVIAVVKFLAQRGMQFRGDDQVIGS